MADLVTKIRTDKGDLPIDYNALANKPTAATIGAVRKTGDTMTGNLTINNDSGTTSAIGLQAPNDSKDKSAYSRIIKNANATADYGLQLRDYAHGGNETGNSSMLTICSKNSNLKDKIKFVNEVDGVSTTYRLYGEHNKPTLSDLGITDSISGLDQLNGLTASVTELNYVDGVTSNIQTQLNNKLPIAGGTLTGNLTVDIGGTSSVLLYSPQNSNNKKAYGRVFKNASATTDYGLQLKDTTYGGDDNDEYCSLAICNYNQDLKNKIKFTHKNSEGIKTYSLYGEHNKPTASDLGITSVSGNAGSATVLKNPRTIRTNLASTSAASFDGSANITPGVTGTLPIANGGTGATTADGIRANLGNLGKVYRSNPIDAYVANNTTSTLATLTLPAGNYVVTGNHTWQEYTAGSIYNDTIRNANNKIYCFCRNLMDNGGGTACSAIIELTEETTIVYETRHFHTEQSKAIDVHFYAIKIK